ncbi:MAG TPA: hypothetical protein VIY47_01350 [Ignavibacteriaceae bacterium]
MLNFISSTKKCPYVYMCTERETGRFYIGYRYRNYLPSSEDFGKIYFTSNSYVKENFDSFDHQIIAEFFDKKAAYKFETDFINETKSDLQINSDKFKKLIGMKYNKII